MSTLVTKYVQLGSDATVANNYVISTPVSPDGSLRISNGVVGNATDVMVIKPTTIQFSQNIGIGKAPTTPLDINGEIRATSFSGGTFSGTFSGSFSGDGSALTNLPITFASSAENIAGTVENKAVDPLGIREAFNATGSAPVFACRAWVNFKGTGTVAIRASGNVSSITDNGVAGDYTVNFTTAMPDENYSPQVTNGSTAADATEFKILAASFSSLPTLMSTSQLRVAGPQDCAIVSISVFR